MPTSSAPIQRAGVIALSGQEALYSKLDKIGSNIANSRTNGFKGFITKTHEVKYNQPGQSPLSYADTRFTIDFSQGSLEQTQNQFDIAISGPGLFTFLSKDKGIIYSRDGKLSMSNDGVLINSLGDQILNESGSQIAIPATAKHVSIAADGTVATEAGIIDKIGLVDFADKLSLTPIGEGYYKTTERGKAVENPNIVQGFVEASNVNAISETIALVEIARLYENAQKVSEDDAKRQSKVINLSSTNHV